MNIRFGVTELRLFGDRRLLQGQRPRFDDLMVAELGFRWRLRRFGRRNRRYVFFFLRSVNDSVETSVRIDRIAWRIAVVQEGALIGTVRSTWLILELRDSKKFRNN